MLTTAGDLVSFALRTAGILGVGQTASAEDSSTGLQLLENILAEWQRRRWLTWSLVDTALLSTGAQSYSIGPAADFAVARPDVLDAAYARIVNTSGGLQTDATLTVIRAREDYARLGLKALSTFPVAVYYESAVPSGRLWFWPVPPAGAFELHVLTKATLPSPVLLATDLGVPPEYAAALVYAVAVDLCINYGLEPRPSLVARRRVCLNGLAVQNTQLQTAGMPGGLSTGRGGSVAAGSSAAFQSGLW